MTVNSKLKIDDRTKNVSVNIVYSLIVKSLNILINLLIVPVSLNVLDNTQYGIWMTLTSVISWISMFDIGLGNGLRNVLSKELAVSNSKESQNYVSTTYFLLGIITIVLTLLFLPLNNFIDWTIIFNTSYSYKNELSQLVKIVFCLFFVKLTIQTIKIILIADQRSAYSNLLETLGNGLGLLVIYLLSRFSDPSLIEFGTIFTGVPIVVFIIFSVFLFSGKYKSIKPRFKYVKIKYSKLLLNTGFQFFIIQFAVVVIFQTSNILVAQFFSPEEVTPYNIAFKYFGVIPMLWAIIMMPMWSAFTHALALKDFIWMKKTMKKLNILMILFFVLSLFMIPLGSDIIAIWTNDRISISTNMLVVFSIYAIINIWNNTYSYFLNGVGFVKLQMITSIVAMLVHIPLSYFFVKYVGFGSEGVALSMVVVLSFFAIVGPIQTINLFRHKWKI